MALDRGAAAALRLRSTATRLRELQQRIDRLSTGEASTQDDVDRARAAADAERLEYARARERLAAAYESATGRHLEVGALLRGTGHRHWPDQHRAVTSTTIGRNGARSGPGTAGPLDPAPPDDSTSEFARSEQNHEEPQDEERLLNAFVAIVGTRGSGRSGSDWDRSRMLWRAVVEQCKYQHWQNWARAVCIVATHVLPSVRGAAVTTYDDTGVTQPVAASDGWTRQVEEIHQLLGEGPAVTAHSTGLPVLVPSLETEQARWPGYVGEAAETGLTGLWSIPLLIAGSMLGALTLYRIGQARPEAQEWADATLLAGVATSVLWADADAMERGWDDDSDGYVRVSVAAGMVSAQLGVSMTEAMSRVRAHAFASGSSLAVVAEAIVEGGLRLG